MAERSAETRKSAKSADEPLQSLIGRLARPFVCEELFSAIPDTVFFVKDEAGRYVAANQVLAERTGFARKEALIGLAADAVFPGELGRRIAEQDRALLRSGRSLKGELELHLYPNGREGWCLTWKEPLVDPARRILGLVGLSRDVRVGEAAHGETAALSRALRFARERPGAAAKVSDFASRAGLSAFQFDARVRAMFGLSAGQFLARLRIGHASERLRQGDETISQIALDCGYGDQTAFTRQFSKIVGVSPAVYRKIRKAPVAK